MSKNKRYKVTYRDFENNEARYLVKKTKHKNKQGCSSRDDKYKLYETYNSGFALPSPEVFEAELLNHGNGIKIKFQDGTKLDLDYSQVHALKILLHISEDEGMQIKAIK